MVRFHSRTAAVALAVHVVALLHEGLLPSLSAPFSPDIGHAIPAFAMPAAGVLPMGGLPEQRSGPNPVPYGQMAQADLLYRQAHGDARLLAFRCDFPVPNLPPFRVRCCQLNL
jgi:hypothetical protein